MSDASTKQSVECPICGDEFDPTVAGGWCTNTECGEWQYTEGSTESDILEDESAESESTEPDDGFVSGTEDEEDDSGSVDLFADEADDGAEADDADGAVDDNVEEDGAEEADDAYGAVDDEVETDETDADDEIAADAEPEVTDDEADADDEIEVDAEPEVADDEADADDDLEADDGEADETVEAEDDAGAEADTIDCPDCGVDLDAEANFCVECGADVSDVLPGEDDGLDACPGCGADVEEEDNFCVNCGEDLDAHRRSDEDHNDAIDALEANADDDGAAETPASLLLEVEGREVHVDDGDTVGREIRAALTEAGRPDDEAVRIHREHVRFVREENTFYLLDLGDNPTQLNGRTLQKGDREPVAPGDELELSGVASVTVQAP